MLIVEDVAYRELGFTAERPPTLWSLAPDIVVQAGTTSKTFFPGVRLGWAVGPPAVVAQMVIAKQNSDQCAGAFGQRLLEEYMRGGHLDPQLRQSSQLYADRCRLMLAALEEHMPEEVSWTRPRGGFFTWLTGPGHSTPWRSRGAPATPASPSSRGGPSIPTRDGLNTPATGVQPR